MFVTRHLWSQVAFATAAALATSAPVLAATGPDVTGPIVHERLAVYFIHGKSAEGPVPLTLAEALAKGAVTVHETGTVNELAIENTSDEEVFIQSGDIVKGGQQDRTLTVSMIVPPKSGRVPLAAFCVEQGRWAQRGGEDVTAFASSEKMLPSKDAKLALRQMVKGIIGADGETKDTSDKQMKVWDSVSKAQADLSENLGVAAVASEASPSSLQLTLESGKVEETVKTYVAALEAKGLETQDIVGFAFAVDGKLASAEVYPSNGLFRKMWPKLLRASATEAIGAVKAEDKAEAPKPEGVAAYLAEADAAKAETGAVDAANVVETRDTDDVSYVETKRAKGDFVHRSYMVK
ncbi:MAG: DUF6569 family protein [Hyphomicrobiaceae bacterium]